MPDFKEYMRQNLRLPGVAGAHETEIVEELALEFEQRYERALGMGMRPEDAWEDAKKQVPDWREFGRELRAVLRENHAAEPEPARTPNLLSTLLGDFRFAIRLLRRNPAFAWAVVLVVALGIGPNTAMFSAVYSVFWAPAPWAKRGQMVVLWSRSRDGRLRLHATVDDLDRTRVHVSPRDYAEWKQHSRSFQAFGALQHTTMTMNDDSDRPERIQTELLTPGFLTMQDRKFVLGRDFLPEEGAPGNHHVVVLSRWIWQQRFGGDPKIIGRRVWLDGEPYAVIGVTADTNRGEPLWPVLVVGGDPAHQDDRRLTVLALLKRGASIGQAQAEMDVISARLEESLPSADAGLMVSVEPARNNWLSTRTSMNLWLLMGAVTLILLIACANAANLLLARGGARMKELAVRASLGAGRWRIFQQLLTESLLLSALGGAAGIALAWVVLKSFLAIIPPDSVPADTPIALSLPALLFAVGTTLFAGCAFGSAPAWRAARLNVNESLKQASGVGKTREGHRLLKILVVAEFALTLTLLCTAGLAMQTFWRRTHLDLGLRTDHILTFEVPLRRDLFTGGGQIRSFYLQLIAKIKAIPEVANVAAVNVGILTGPGSLPITITGNPPLAGSQSPPRVAIRVATPGFFQTVGARVVRGRNIDEHDLPDSAPVVLVNERFVRRFLPDADPLRKELGIPVLDPATRFQVVGVFHDIQNAPEFGKENVPEVCISFNQVPLRMMTVVVSSSLDPDLLRTDIATALHSLDRSLPMANVRTMEQIASGRLAFDRFEAAVYGSFAGLALLLATVGMYGVVAYFVTQRTPELGLRIALGANPAQIVELILRQGLTLAIFGLMLGMGCAWWAGRLIESTLYGAGPPNVTVMAGVGLVLLATALLATLIPARRAAAVDPTSALRSE